MELLVEHAEIRSFVVESRCMATPRTRTMMGAFSYLPKVDREYSWVHIWDDMYQGKVKGLIAFGMNGVADRRRTSMP